MNMKNEWLLKDGESVPDGTTEKKCPYCGGRYAVPDDVIGEVSDLCERCAPEIAKQMAESEGSKEAADTIKTALGD